MKKLILLFTIVYTCAAVFAQPTPQPGSQTTATWKRNATGFWLYMNGTRLENTVSVWVENDLLIYDAASTTTFLLTDYKNAVNDQMYDAVVLSKADDHFWRTNGKSYWIYFKGVALSGTTSGWVTNDLIVYNAATNTTILLKDYKNAVINKVYTAEMISTQNTEFWRTYNGLFWVYSKGVDLTGLVAFWFENDMVVYYPPTNTTYYLKGYKSGIPNKIYTADILSTSDHVFWWQKDGSYWLYAKGVSVDDVKSYWYHNDMIVYQPSTNTSYILKDYENGIENKIFPSTILSTTDHIFWWQKDGSYWLYDKGEYLKELTSRYEGDDLIVTDTKTNIVYLLKDYKKLNDDTIRPGMIRN